MTHSHHEFNKIAKNEAEKPKYPPPFSLRLTYKERARLDAERGDQALGGYIRERLFGDDAAPRKKRGNAMTAAWSKGKTKHYAYYRCETRGCEAKSKSIPRAKLETEFAEIMQGLQPARGLFDLAKAMLRDAWNMRLAVAHGEKDELQRQLKDVERQIESLLDRIVDANSASVVSAYEARIEKLERQKIVLAERVETTVPPKGPLEDCIELALDFLANPWIIYKKGDFTLRQTVLRLVFSKPLKYGQNGVHGTPELSFPLKYLAGISGEKSEMVRVKGLEPPRLAAPEPKSGASTNFATPAMSSSGHQGPPRKSAPF